MALDLVDVQGVSGAAGSAYGGMAGTSGRASDHLSLTTLFSLSLPWLTIAMSNNFQQDELNRRHIRSQALLDLLKDRKWHLNVELAQPEHGGHSFNAHIKTLRDSGWVIKCEHVEGPLFRYKLIRQDKPIDYTKTMNIRQKAVANAYTKAIKSLLGREALLQVHAAVPEHYRLTGQRELKSKYVASDIAG